MLHTSAGLNSDSCARCGQQIYPLELMGQIMGLRYHKQCFKCSVCDRNLDFKNYQTNVIDLTDKQIYCSSHAPKNGKGTIDFQAADNIPRNILNEYEPERKSSVASLHSQKSTDSRKLEAKAAEIVLNVCDNSVGSFGNVADESDDDDALRVPVIINSAIKKTDNKPHKSEGDAIDEVQWKEIYEHDPRLDTQLSSDSAFYRGSTEKLDKVKWEYLGFKAGSGSRPHQQTSSYQRTPDTYRKQYGPYDSAFRPNKYDYGKISWKEIFENAGDKTTYRQAKRSNLDLLDRDELTWREIYEGEYKFARQQSAENIAVVVTTEEEPEPEPEPLPLPVSEKIIDTLSMDSSLVKKIPSRENMDVMIDKEKIKSESFVSTKETSTYHHQLIEKSSKKHVSVCVPNIINNRESALDIEVKPTIQITKSTEDDQEALEKRRKVLEELNKQKQQQEQQQQPTKIDAEAEVKKVIEPAIVIPSKPVQVEIVKPPTVIIKETKIIGENKGYGVVKLTIHYDELRSRLSITVHQAQNLKNVEKNAKKNDLSDPYVRIYLVPDEKKRFKRKTKVVKNNLNPKWDETFDYKLSFEQSVVKDLIVSLKDDKKGLFSKQETRMLGEVRLRLAEIGIKKPFTRWFFLQPLGAVSKMLLNSGINPYKN